ncbi:MAG: glucans biosynthesis glucosyltransferase MdoH [Geminicoccaceae bacterium]|nr:glucans biosynthesis glucosyltransferase MdoH [Geminicoccaceae bacterium]
MTPTETSTLSRAPDLAARRGLFAFLVMGSSLLAMALLAAILGGDGINGFDVVMLATFALTLPWTMIGFWNAIIGFAMLRLARDPVAAACPPLARIDRSRPLRGRTAILMVVHDEEPHRVFGHLRALEGELAATPDRHLFDYAVLSDTRDDVIAASENRFFDRWKQETPDSSRVEYRRRLHNTNHKTGNIWEFLERRGHEFDYFLVLDADSSMSADLVRDLVRMMDDDEQLGVVQPLIVGLPNNSAFARIFQLGMRHGMRAYTTGSAWWQGDAGPYWGHNGILRTKAFIDHCRLPTLPGKPPMGGMVLSHDQVEAAMMRAAGYRIHVLPVEDGSYEENPPTLQDFIKRDLRWCQGNMQYLRLIGRDGFLPMGRLQLVLAILMYVASPAWLLFMFAGVAQVIWTSVMGSSAQGSMQLGLGIVLFAMMMAVNFTPKIAGLVDVLMNGSRRRAYGGTRAILSSAVIETFFSLFLGPIMAVSQTVFLVGLARGRTIRWDAQRRSVYELSFMEALRGLWPQTLVGLAMAGLLAVFAPAVLPWASPVLVGLLLAIPFAWLTSRRSFGALLARYRICATPEELAQAATVTASGLAKPQLPAHAGRLELETGKQAA